MAKGGSSLQCSGYWGVAIPAGTERICMKSQHDVSGKENDGSDVARAISFLREKKVGLVLAGGGGKGAYQAGCLDYLRTRGITNFHVITGSSVGSLNGAAAGCNKVEEIVEVWKRMSIRRVLVPSWRLLPFVPGMLFVYSSHVPGLFTIAWLVGVGILCYELWTFSAVYLLLFLCLFVPIAIMVPGVITLPINILGTLVDRFLSRHASVAKAEPLRKLVESVLLADEAGSVHFSCPVFATITRRAYWFDPDAPSFANSTGIGTAFSSPNFSIPVEAPGWLPEYVDMSNLGQKELIDYLLASAALPFAFRPIPIGDDHYVDGGVVDNIPLNKALDYDCDIVIVIYLQEKVNLRISLEHIPRLRRAINLSKVPVEDSHRRYMEWLQRSDVAERYGGDPTDTFPWYENETYPPSSGRFEVVPPVPLGPLPAFVEVIPSRSLAGLINGTLNFRARKARNLLKLGRADMKDALSRFARSAVPIEDADDNV